jgi:cytidylate kinase
MPLYTSSYVFEDESVPFLSIVLKGVMPVYSEYVNFEANKQEFFLKLVETGTYPSFYITKEDSSELIYTNSSDIYSSQYSVYKDVIIEYTEALEALNEKVGGSFITGHDINANGVTVVTYDNGVKVYVNYSSAEQTIDGVTIPSMSYEVR